jgi:hypothetical protein
MNRRLFLLASTSLLFTYTACTQPAKPGVSDGGQDDVEHDALLCPRVPWDNGSVDAAIDADNQRLPVDRCTSSDTCSPGYFCRFGDQSCGEVQEGRCFPRPAECRDVAERVCGCDGNVYLNECEASRNGFDLASDARCKPPTGWFSCGHRFCEQKKSFCETTVNHITGAIYNPRCGCVATACEALLNDAKAACDCVRVRRYCSCGLGTSGNLSVACSDL